MIISIPDKFTIDQSEKSILSIRLQPGGLSFSVYNPSIADTYFYRSIVFERSESYLNSLKECFFSNEFLSWTYKRVNIVWVSGIYTMVPADFYQDNLKADILSYNFFTSDIQPLVNFLPDEDAQIIFGINQEVYDFCCRSIIHPHFIHHLTPVLPVCKKISSTVLYKNMFIIVQDKLLDIICYHQRKLVFINSFAFDQLNDLLYYILYVWQQMGLDQQRDYLNVAGKGELYDSLLKALETYIKYVEPMEIPSEAYLHGGEILNAPIDLIALSVCE